MTSTTDTTYSTVVIVDTNGTTKLERWPAAKDGDHLERLQSTVGGLVDVVALTDTLDMWVHDEGLFCADSNPIATAIALRHGQRQPYYGPAVFTGGADIDGRTRPLDAGTAGQLLDTARQLQRDALYMMAITAWGQRFAAASR